MNITFSSYDELRCLHLTICEAKFHEDPNRKEIQGSPFVAETADKVFDLLISEAPSEEKSKEWKEHRILDSRYVIYPAIQRRCEEYFESNDLSREERLAFLKSVAAPYIVPESLVQILTSCS